MSTQAVLFDAPGNSWWRFSNPLQVVTAHHPEQVLPALATVEKAAAAGLHAVGLLAYEAAPAFDPACRVHAGGDFPLLWFGLFAAPRRIELAPPPAAAATGPWAPGLDADRFAAAVATIRDAIERGASYQVNFSFPLRSAFAGDPWEFFRSLVHGQQAGHAAYLDLGRHVVCSASPELFFRREGDLITTRPMKGTARRGRTPAADLARAQALQTSAKERAENLMVLDMLRNDLARLGGEVRVPALFSLERYPTLWQLTSTAATRSRASLGEIFRALFPCASITGAPKIETMRLIAELEGEARGIYTGAIGHLAPDGSASFGVAIRTALVDRAAASIEYRVGAGITWDSDSGAEYRECLDKAAILQRPVRPFELLESLRWTPQEGYWLEPEHLQRMAESAAYFGFPCDPEELRAQLARCAATLPAAPHKVRLLLAADGAVTTTGERLAEPGAALLRLRLAETPVDAEEELLYHKTTWRRVYEEAREAATDCDEVLLWNRRGEITEAATANLVIELDGDLVTPPISCGLLPGTLRYHLLARGEIREGIITRAELERARGIWLINAVRGWRPARLVGAEESLLFSERTA